MKGRTVGLAILGAAALAGGGLFYLEQYHWYDLREGEGDIVLTGLSGVAAPIPTRDFLIAEGLSSPLKFRACFTTSAAPGALAARFAPYPEPEPTVAPLSFPCFDAAAIAEALAAGDAQAFLGTAHVTYGIDRVVAITDGGAGFSWHQINACGARVFDGEPPPPRCPPPPTSD